MPDRHARSYSDTYGAPRSGGRSHKGVDILAPMRTPLYAYENGVVTRMSSNSFGGITLCLRGDSGNLYYYAHLSGYVDSVNPGDRSQSASTSRSTACRGTPLSRTCTGKSCRVAGATSTRIPSESGVRVSR